ncbi:response regulator [uncultured Clostridium sp.]|uniref:response regulator transcription factor n=1 Tax=uncultured Clostridium sp. TaxID=59620 RepID=UPI0025854077|nr:response regulator [uncultured Clostridium sp.]
MKSFYKVLIVDDESILRNGLKHLCNWEDEGFKLIGEAANGKEALEIIKDKEPNIVITDLIMPEIDGIELSKIIRRKYPRIKVLVLSNISEFDYVKESFKYGIYDYLLKTEASPESMLPILKSMVKEIDSNNLNENKYNEEKVLENLTLDLILGKEIDKDSLENLFKYFILENYCLLISEINKEDDDLKELENIKRIIKGNIKDALVNYIIITTFIKNKIIIVINYNKNAQLKMLKDIEIVTKSIFDNYEISPFVLTEGNNIKNNIHYSYEESLIIKNKSIYFDKALIKKSDIRERSIKIKFDYDLFNSFIGKLDFDGCISMIKKYLDIIKENTYMEEYDLKKFCQNLIYNALSSLENYDSELINISKKKIVLFKKIDIARSFNELVNIVIDTFKYIDDLSQNSLNSKNNSYIIKIVKDYVDKNYKDEISVATISKDLSINYNYLSYCFKNETSENLSSYISKVRVEKAKIYLEDFKIPIANISEMVGFSEHNYFSKIFKKYTSLTPTEYRRMVKINDKKR